MGKYKLARATRFRAIFEEALWTDRQTDRQTDRPSYRETVPKIIQLNPAPTDPLLTEFRL